MQREDFSQSTKPKSFMTNPQAGQMGQELNGMMPIRNSKMEPKMYVSQRSKNYQYRYSKQGRQLEEMAK
jgi:hypothetical protein